MTFLIALAKVLRLRPKRPQKLREATRRGKEVHNSLSLLRNQASKLVLYGNGCFLLCLSILGLNKN